MVSDPCAQSILNAKHPRKTYWKLENESMQTVYNYIQHLN